MCILFLAVLGGTKSDSPSGKALETNNVLERLTTESISVLKLDQNSDLKIFLQQLGKIFLAESRVGNGGGKRDSSWRHGCCQGDLFAGPAIARLIPLVSNFDEITKTDIIGDASSVIHILPLPDHLTEWRLIALRDKKGLFNKIGQADIWALISLQNGKLTLQGMRFSLCFSPSLEGKYSEQERKQRSQMARQIVRIQKGCAKPVSDWFALSMFILSPIFVALECVALATAHVSPRSLVTVNVFAATVTIAAPIVRCLPCFLTSHYRCVEDILVFQIVILETKLGDVERQVLPARLVESTNHATLEDAPKDLDGVGMDRAAAGELSD